jgi:UDP-N-acetylglucosamine acyltransferase
MTVHPRAIVEPGAEIDENVDIGANVFIGPHVKIHRGTVVYPNAYITGWTEIGENCQIHIGAVLGHEPQDYAYKGEETYLRIGPGNVFREYVLVHRGTAAGSATEIGSGNMFMGYSHVAHNCRIGDNVTLVNGSQLAGHVQVGDGAFISANVMVHQFCRVGSLAMVGGLSATNQDIPPYVTCGGRPVAVTGINSVGLRRAGKDKKVRDNVKEAFKILYRQKLNITEALKKMEEIAETEEVRHLMEFIRSSERGIIFSAMKVEERSRSSI